MTNDLLLEPDDYEPDHVKHSVGGMGGHLFRRAVHLAMAILPWIYYWNGDYVAELFSVTPLNLPVRSFSYSSWPR